MALAEGRVVDRSLIPDHVFAVPSFRVSRLVVPEDGISFRGDISDFEKKLIRSPWKLRDAYRKSRPSSLV